MLLPIFASCGLCLEDEAVRVAIALRLGLDLCVPHTCHCGTSVYAWFACKRAPGRHHAVNDVVSTAFVSAEVPTTKTLSASVTATADAPMGSLLSLGNAVNRCVGRHCGLHSGRLVRQHRSHLGGYSRRVGINPQSRQICSPPRVVHFLAHSI